MNMLFSFVPSPLEIVILAIVALIAFVFVSRRYPSLLRSMGKGVGKLTNTGQHVEREVNNQKKEG